MSTLKVNAIEPYSGGTVTITGASIDSASYAETANTLTAGNKTINGTLDVNGTENLNGNLIQQTPGGINTIYQQNPAFFSQYHGNALQWNPNSGLGGNAILTVAEKAEAAFQANAFSGSYDNVVTIKANAGGGQFSDWDLPSYGDNIWLQIPQAGTPSFKRGLEINGTTTTNGTMFVSSSINQSLTTILPDSVKTRDNTGVVQSSLETSFGGKIGLVNLGTSDDFGLTLQSENWGFPPNWTGPSIYSNNPAGEYPAIIGFQNKTNWTDGRVTFLTPIVIQSGSTIVGLGDYVDDAAAALGGVAVNGVYRTGSALKIRVS